MFSCSALMGEAKKSFMSSLWNVCVNMSNMILVSLRLINVVVIYVVNQFVVVELLYRGIVFFFLCLRLFQAVKILFIFFVLCKNKTILCSKVSP